MTDTKTPLSLIGETARPPDAPLCYEGIYSAGQYRTWRDFLDDTGRLRRSIRGGGGNRTNGYFIAKTIGFSSPR
ncbi:MAG: hypothetical protein LBG87_01165 [Spirochaetaceae bacterium]|jgi:hypothetical protein|nr:hypothetical protein [Spirochaetaceae bacterium]